MPVAQQRKLKKQQLKQHVHTLAQEGLSDSAIARAVGIHRITVKRWRQQPPLPPLVDKAPVDHHSAPLPPLDPWSSWDEVRQVREILQEHRYLLLRRPENLTSAEQEHIDALLASPVGSELKIARSFLTDWYRLWKDENGLRRSFAEAQRLYDAWRTNETYRTVPQLRYAQTQMTASKFERLGQFLHHPHWEATNNGAERTGRAFRHRQAPHFNLRKKETIETAINVTACLAKEETLRPPAQPFHTCQRGRRKQQPLSQRIC